LLKKKLVEESKKVREHALGEKNNHQQIRLICNVITPDNFDKKFKELRKYIFGDLKTNEEKGFNQQSDQLVE
jgi:hypothetical protein